MSPAWFNAHRTDVAGVAMLVFALLFAAIFLVMKDD
jgi:hypothetical protein